MSTLISSEVNWALLANNKMSSENKKSGSLTIHHQAIVGETSSRNLLQQLNASSCSMLRWGCYQNEKHRGKWVAQAHTSLRLLKRPRGMPFSLVLGCWDAKFDSFLLSCTKNHFQYNEIKKFTVTMIERLFKIQFAQNPWFCLLSSRI